MSTPLQYTLNSLLACKWPCGTQSRDANKVFYCSASLKKRVVRCTHGLSFIPETSKESHQSRCSIITYTSDLPLYHSLRSIGDNFINNTACKHKGTINTNIICTSAWYISSSHVWSKLVSHSSRKSVRAPLPPLGTPASPSL